MTRFSFLIMIVLCAVMSPASEGAAPPGRDDFQYCADLRGAFKGNALYMLHLSGGIIEKSRARFTDLRLFNARGKEIPYVIINEDYPGEPVQTYALEITDYSSDSTSALITAKLPKGHRPISSIELKIDDRDFHKKVLLSGSSDMQSWRVLAEAGIYDFSSQVDLRNTTIPFQQSRERYYRLKLTDVKSGGNHQQSIKLKYEGLDFSVNAVEKRALRIQRIAGMTGQRRKQQPVYDRKVFSDVPMELDKQGNSVIVLKADLPMDRILFTLSNPYFSRAIRLRYSDTGNDGSYRLLTRSTIYRFTLSGRHESKDYIESRSQKQVYYEIVVENKNNPPLALERITIAWVRKNLYFIALNDGEGYTLCFGNPILPKPKYDLGRFINRNSLSQHAFQQIQTAPVRENSSYVPPTHRGRRAHREKIVLSMVVILLVGGLGYWIYRLVRKITHERDTHGKHDA